MKITALVENTSHRTGVRPLHGLSLYIESKNCNILFDMGQDDLFIKNAEILGVDLSKADIAVISHGHYDHGGGLEYFLEINKYVPVYISNLAFKDYYNGAGKYIGLDKKLRDSGRLVFTKKDMEIAPGIWLYTCKNQVYRNEIEPYGLSVKENGILEPENFNHEQYLLIEENGCRVLFSGCSHRGVLNIVDWFKPDYLIGGFHFCKIEDETELKKAAETLNGYATEYYTCHCTGVEEYEVLSKYMSRINYLSCGESINLQTGVRPLSVKNKGRFQ